jgi:hypothetical protein
MIGKAATREPRHTDALPAGRKIKKVPLVPPAIESLRPYEAGRTIDSVQREYGLERVAKLASNENPLGPSPKALEAIARSIGALHRYPDGGLGLREVLAREFDLKERNCGQRVGRHHVEYHPHLLVR